MKGLSGGYGRSPAALALLLCLGFALVIYSVGFNITGFTIYQSQPAPAEGTDSYIIENSSTNYGDSSSLFVGKSAAGKEFRSLLKFNLSSIPTGDTIISATLSLYLYQSGSNGSSGELTLKAYRVTSSWNESNVSWYNRTEYSAWPTNGSTYNAAEIGSFTVSNTTGWYNITITGAARGWINGSYSNNGLVLIAQNPLQSDYKFFYSSDYATDQSRRPIMTVDHSGNAAPFVVNLTTNSGAATMKGVGENVTFNMSWLDLESNDAKLVVCNNSNITLAAGCNETTFCSTSLSPYSPLNCSYTVRQQDNRTMLFWAAACDSYGCSDANASYFVMNHQPVALVTSPNGGEIINQSQGGNFTITFNASDADADTLTADIYYGATQNSTQTAIARNLSVASVCTGDFGTITIPNECSFSWNSSGAYGPYFITVVLNDTRHTGLDSSNANFTAVSIFDNVKPVLANISLDSGYLYSGRLTLLTLNMTDQNPNSAWALINTTPQQRIGMSNGSQTGYGGSFIAPAPGAYQYKVYANDTVGNTNESMDWVVFIVYKPNASAQNITSPSRAQPYGTIKASAYFNATDGPRGVYAYLNVPDGFTFQSDYPQNAALGNFSPGQSKEAVWFLSAPIAEANYTINATLTDMFSNTWQSPDTYVNVTYVNARTTGDVYALSLSHYSEVETANAYFAQASFTDNGAYNDPDSITLKLYDALGNLVAGPASMSKYSTGIYNYTYTVGSSVSEGQWETRVNATKGSSSYYANQFWKVVGGPFDVRNITIDDDSISNISITVTTENTGGATKDLTLEWNLTRVDTGQVLDSAAETFAVNASSTRIWTVHPSTGYVGQVKITFIGHYSGTEKAGAYKIFSTTAARNATQEQTGPGGGAASGGGGAGGGGAATVPELKKQPELNISLYEDTIYVTKNIRKVSRVIIDNIGTGQLTSVNLRLAGLSKKYYNITPLLVPSIDSGKSAAFQIDIMVDDLSGDVEFTYEATSDQSSKSAAGRLVVLSPLEYLKKEIERLRARVGSIKKSVRDEGLLTQLGPCEIMVDDAENFTKSEEVLNANAKIKEADTCMDNIESKYKALQEGPATPVGDMTMWIILVVVIGAMVAFVVAFAILIYRKLSVMSFLKREEASAKKEEHDKADLKEKFFYDKLEEIQKKLKQQEGGADSDLKRAEEDAEELAPKPAQPAPQPANQPAQDAKSPTPAAKPEDAKPADAQPEKKDETK